MKNIKNIFGYYRLPLSVCIFLFLFTAFLSAQNTFRADAIPESLRPYANAVVRLSETVHTVVSPSLVETTRRHVVTVMNTQGAAEGMIVIPYNKLIQIKSLQATIYDANGHVLKKIKMSEFEDLSFISPFSLFEDDRMKKYIPQVNMLPYTVEYQYKLRTRTTFFLPPWRPQNRPGLAVESSTCQLITPADFMLRDYVHKLTPATEQVIAFGKQKQTQWTLENTPAWRDEPFLPPVDSISPYVMFAPVHFAIDGMKGSFTNWEEYGLWCYNNLLKGRDKLPDETVARIRKMTDGIDSQREKARRIYDYCQQKNRYISIQKGRTGGITPMSAAEVDRLSYGDCKALCNYTRALLEAVNIRAYYAIIQADHRPANPPETFASADFGNHIVLCLPLDGDTVWLECTNRKAPFGYLGSFTGNRKAILCASDGGRLAHTTTYLPEENRQESIAQFTLDNGGTLTGNITTHFVGMQYDNRNEELATLNTERINELKKIYGSFPAMEIRSYALTFDKEQIITTERLQLESARFASITGNRMYIPVNPVNPFESLPRDLRTRTHDVCISNGYRDTDSISFNIPDGYQVESLPLLVNLNEQFGMYFFEVKAKERTVYVYRRLQLNNITLPPERYNDVVSFLKKVYSNDHAKVVLVKE